MPRIAGTASVLVLLTLAVAVPPAGGDRQARSSALLPLETLVVPAGQGQTYPLVTSKTKLRKGASTGSS